MRRLRRLGSKAISPLFGALMLAGPFLLALSDAWAEPAVVPAILLRVEGHGPAGDPAWLSAALARSPGLGAVLLYRGPADGLAEAAARARCDLVVEARTEPLEPGEARSEWRVASASRDTLAEGVIEGPAPTERDAATFWWLPLVAATERAAEGLVPPSASVLRIAGPPGAVVSFRQGGSARRSVELSAEGLAELPVEPPATLGWRVEAKGRYPASGVVAVLADGETLAVPGRPLRRLALELGTEAMQYPDAYAAYGLLESYLWLGVGLGQYALGLSLGDASVDEPDPPFLASSPLFMPGLFARGYALPPDAPVRPYLTAAAAARIYARPGASPVIEPLAPLVGTVRLGAEWSLADGVAAFIELGGAYYPLADGIAMAASRNAGSDGSVFLAYGDDWFWEFLPPRAGVRVYVW